MSIFASRFLVTRSTLAAQALLAVVSLAGAAVAGAQCVGDCNGDASVAINELIMGVNIALGTQPATTCPAFQDGSGQVNISQLIKGVNNALGSCPTGPTPTATTAGGTPTATVTNDTPTPAPTPGSCGTPASTPVCGNGAIEPGETCDDCNTVDGDNCPATCVIHDCQSTPSTLNVDAVVHVPASVTPGALQIFLRYPDGVVSLPSSGSQASIAISNLPDDAFSTSVNDLDYAVRVVSVGPDGLTLGSAPAGRFFTAQFNLCQGASAPTAADFHCTVENATSVPGDDITAMTTCSVALP